MSASHKPTDPKKLPVPYRPKSGEGHDIEHHTREWSSGSRGGGSVPADLEWRTNPKQEQEENGATTVDQPLSK